MFKLTPQQNTDYLEGLSNERRHNKCYHLYLQFDRQIAKKNSSFTLNIGLLIMLLVWMTNSNQEAPNEGIKIHSDFQCLARTYSTSDLQHRMSSEIYKKPK